MAAAHRNLAGATVVADLLPPTSRGSGRSSLGGTRDLASGTGVRRRRCGCARPGIARLADAERRPAAGSFGSYLTLAPIPRALPVRLSPEALVKTFVSLDVLWLPGPSARENGQAPASPLERPCCVTRAGARDAQRKTWPTEHGGRHAALCAIPRRGEEPQAAPRNANCGLNDRPRGPRPFPRRSPR
jgi:hypothetical protein